MGMRKSQERRGEAVQGTGGGQPEADRDYERVQRRTLVLNCSIALGLIWLGMTNPQLGRVVVIAGTADLVFNACAFVLVVGYYRRSARRH